MAQASQCAAARTQRSIPHAWPGVGGTRYRSSNSLLLPTATSSAACSDPLAARTLCSRVLSTLPPTSHATLIIGTRTALSFYVFGCLLPHSAHHTSHTGCYESLCSDSTNRFRWQLEERGSHPDAFATAILLIFAGLLCRISKMLDVKPLPTVAQWRVH